MLSTLALPPTKTYARREAIFLPAFGDCDGRLGSLTILLCGKRTRFEGDRYIVAPGVSAPGHRQYLLANQSDPKADEIYTVTIGRTPALDDCTCRAGQTIGGFSTHDRCKHMASLRALLDEGVID